MSLNSPVKGDSNVFVGEDRALQFEVVDSSSQIVDVTGWSIEWVLRDYAEAPTARLTKTTAAGGVVISDGPLGIVRVLLPRADTLTLGAQTYFYTLRRTDSGYAGVLAFGDFVVKEPSTR